YRPAGKPAQVGTTPEPRDDIAALVAVDIDAVIHAVTGDRSSVTLQEPDLHETRGVGVDVQDQPVAGEGERPAVKHALGLIRCARGHKAIRPVHGPENAAALRLLPIGRMILLGVVGVHPDLVAATHHALRHVGLVDVPALHQTDVEPDRARIAFPVDAVAAGHELGLDRTRAAAVLLIRE